MKLLVAELSVLLGLFSKRKEQYGGQTFLISESGEESEQTSLVLSCLRCFYSITGLWVTFSYPVYFALKDLMSCAFDLEHMHDFKK